VYRRVPIIATVLSLAVSAPPALAQGPSPATVPLPLTPETSTADRPDSFADPDALFGSGYRGYAIDRLFVLNAVGARDRPLTEQPVASGCNAYDVITNGTFFRENPRQPISPLIRAGHRDAHDPHDFALRRGAVAVRADGTIVVGRADGLSEAEIATGFGDDLQEFMGGGILLIEEGRKVPLRDIVFTQHVQNRPPAHAGEPWEQLVDAGVWPDQCRATSHALVAIRKGQAYLLSAGRASCSAIQDALTAEGFGAAVMFDGGRVNYLAEAGKPPHLTPRGGSAFPGLAVYRRTQHPVPKGELCPDAPVRCGLDGGNGGCEMAAVSPLPKPEPLPLPPPLPRRSDWASSCKARPEIGEMFRQDVYVYCKPHEGAVGNPCATAHCITRGELAGLRAEFPGLKAEWQPNSCRPACDEAAGFKLQDRIGFEGVFCGRCPNVNGETLRYHRGYGCCR